MDQMKKCPQCGQYVKSEALKCRFCGYWFNAATSNEAPQNSSVPPQQPSGQQPGAGPQQGQQWQQQQQGQQQWQQSQQQQWQQQNQQQQWQQQQNQQQQWQQQGYNPYPQSQSLLTVSELLTEGTKLGMTNFLSIFLAYILWGLTCWIPYLNVGTTIGLINLPINLSKSNNMISPTAIFDGKYRKYMGEFFSLTGLMMISLVPAFFFMIAPAIIIGYGWSQAYYLMFDKETSPSDAMLQSTKITYGYKLTLFGADFVIGFLVSILWAFIAWLCGTVIESVILTGIMGLILFAVYSVIRVGMAAIAYRKLSTRLEE